MRGLKISKSITNRETESLDKYLSEIGKIELISTLEEVELTQQIRGGDQQALEKLVKANLRFVVSVAKQYQNQGLSLPDLINEGNLGIIKAAQKFDETRGFKFITYAVWWIRQSILEALAQYGRIIRLPLNKIADLKIINTKYAALEQKLQRSPTDFELMQELEISEENLNHLLEIGQHNISLDTSLSEDSDATKLGELFSNSIGATDKGLDIESLKQDILHVLNTLTEREVEVINMYFRDCVGLEIIGDQIGTGKERARQIKEEAIKKIKENVRSNSLKEHLG